MKVHKRVKCIWICQRFKFAIFREKVTTTNLKDCFPDYDGPNEYEAAIAFIQSTFNNLFNKAINSRCINGCSERDKYKVLEPSEVEDLHTIEEDASTYASGSTIERSLYVHKTCATDREQMHFISDVVYDMILGSSVNVLFV